MRNAVYGQIWEELAQNLIEYALLSACLAVACIGDVLDSSRTQEFYAIGSAVGDVGI